MEKQKTTLLIVVLLGITAACSAYSAYELYQTNQEQQNTYADLKSEVTEANQHLGSKIYYNGNYVEKYNSTISFYPENNYVKVVTGSSTLYIPYQSISAITVSK